MFKNTIDLSDPRLQDLQDVESYNAILPRYYRRVENNRPAEKLLSELKHYERHLKECLLDRSYRERRVAMLKKLKEEHDSVLRIKENSFHHDSLQDDMDDLNKRLPLNYVATANEEELPKNPDLICPMFWAYFGYKNPDESGKVIHIYRNTTEGLDCL